jgi:hypothetical protein
MLRRYAQPVQLTGSNVLAVGGEPTSVNEETLPFATVDAFAPGGTSWLARAPLATPRSRTGAVTLGDGTVLVAGGVGTFSTTAPDPANQTAERYTPAANTWQTEAPPPIATGNPAVLLDDGSVLFINGLRFYPEPW